MTAEQLIYRLEKICQKDKKYEVYFKLIRLPINELLDIIDRVGEQLADQEIDNIIADFKKKIALAPTKN